MGEDRKLSTDMNRQEAGYFLKLRKIELDIEALRKQRQQLLKNASICGIDTVRLRRLVKISNN